jgi:hypothetical protein
MTPCALQISTLIRALAFPSALGEYVTTTDWAWPGAMVPLKGLAVKKVARQMLNMRGRSSLSFSRSTTASPCS